MLKHGMCNTKEYRAHIGAKARCSNPKHCRFKFYGGRGIKFLFASFEEFYKELGIRPEGMSLDRIDTNGHYEPGNVKWSTQSEQVANRRNYKWNKRIGKGYNKHGNRWRVELSIYGQRCKFGSYSTEQEAQAVVASKLEELEK